MFNLVPEKMTTESLFNDIYQDVCTNDYCSICFRTCNERRLVDGKNLAKFKFFRQSNYLEVNVDRFCNQKICYMCDAQAIAANKFCLAVNLSHHIHSLFHKMNSEPDFFTQVKDHLTNGGIPGEVVHNLRNIEDLQKMLEQHRRNTTLLQTETLLLNNPGDEPPSAPTPTPAREKLRDLLTFESQSGIDDDTLFDLDASDIEKQIIIEDDDPIKDEPPDQNVFIIPDELPTEQAVQTDTQTDNTAGYILHPIVLQNGTLTIPSLVKNISVNQPNHIVNGLANNTNNNSKIESLNHFVVLPQTTSNTQIVQTNLNQNMPHLNFVQNRNSLAQDIVSLVKNPTLGQKILNLNQNSSSLERHTVKLLQNTSNLRQNTINSTQGANIIVNMSSGIQNKLNLPNQVPFTKMMSDKITASHVKITTSPVKVTASPVKRSDSDSDTNCQNIQPLRKPEGKIDWEDKIPMDVISFVSPSDPTTTTAKRQKTRSDQSGFVTSKDREDPMGECVITDVKSVRDLEVIDLC